MLRHDYHPQSASGDCRNALACNSFPPFDTLPNTSRSPHAMPIRMLSTFRTRSLCVFFTIAITVQISSSNSALYPNADVIHLEFSEPIQLHAALLHLAGPLERSLASATRLKQELRFFSALCDAWP